MIFYGTALNLNPRPIQWVDSASVAASVSVSSIKGRIGLSLAREFQRLTLCGDGLGRIYLILYVFHTFSSTDFPFCRLMCIKDFPFHLNEHIFHTTVNEPEYSAGHRHRCHNSFAFFAVFLFWHT